MNMQATKVQMFKCSNVQMNTQVTKKTIWITKLMMDLRYMEEKKMMVIQCNNQGAIVEDYDVDET